MNKSKQAGVALLAFRIYKTRYSLPVSAVDSVLELQKTLISTLPCDISGRVRGIFSHKGSIVAIAQVEGLETDADARGSDVLTAVILRDQEHQFALLVDELEAVVETDEGLTSLDPHSLYLGGVQHGN